MKELRGRIFSGEGEGEGYVEKPEYNQFFSKLLDGPPYPGTLNVKLSKEWENLPGWREYKPKSHGKIFFQEAKLRKGGQTLPVILVRPVLTEYKENVVEVIAERCLRRVLNLTDDEEVTIALPFPSTESNER